MDKIHWTKFIKGEYSVKDVIDFFRGNYRYWLYYHPYFYWLIRKHIREQINLRIQVMDQECYQNGSCKLCGCKTTHLQMANKSCEKPCYPPIMKKKIWEQFKCGCKDYYHTLHKGDKFIYIWTYYNRELKVEKYYDRGNDTSKN